MKTVSLNRREPNRSEPPEEEAYDRERVKNLFDAGAEDYDRHRRRIIPCFNDFYGAIIAQVPMTQGTEFAGLDLGAGTGLVSALLLEAFPTARMVMLDHSDAMLVKARERFAGDERVQFVVQDYTGGALPAPFDIVVSAMSIHHLSHEGKQRLYKSIFAALKPGGLVLNADLILGASEAEERMWQRNWREHLAGAGLSSAELSVIFERMASDRPASLDAHLEWMNKAGFGSVACVYQNANFAVLSGISSGARPKQG